MSQLLTSTNECCLDCDTECDVTTAIPGPAGEDGTDGEAGAAGVNAFTATTAPFTMPAEGGTVTVSVSNSTWMSNNQLIYVDTAGYMNVQSKPNSTSVILRNEENTASGLYTGNAPPTTVIAPSSTVSPAGLQGPTGASGAGNFAPDDATYILQVADGDLANAQALSVLASGYMRVTTGTGVVSSQAIPIPISHGGTNATTQTAAFDSLAPTTTQGDIIYFDGSDNVRLAKSATATRYLSNTGTNNDPAWAQVNLANGVTGTLPTANGGVGTTAAWHVYRGTDQSPHGSVLQRVDFDTESFDTANIFDTTTFTLTPASGTYMMTAQVTYASTVTAGTSMVAIYKNGAAIATNTGPADNDAGAFSYASVSVLTTANGADTFQVFAKIYDGSGVNSIEDGAQDSFFCGFRIPI